MACQPKEKGYSGKSTKEEENRARNCRKQITNRKVSPFSKKNKFNIFDIKLYRRKTYHRSIILQFKSSSDRRNNSRKRSKNRGSMRNQAVRSRQV